MSIQLIGKPELINSIQRKYFPVICITDVHRNYIIVLGINVAIKYWSYLVSLRNFYGNKAMPQFKAETIGQDK